MTSRYIFHFDKTKTSWFYHVNDSLAKHDGMKCSANIECKHGLMNNLVKVRFDDGLEVLVFDYELEEIEVG